MGPELLSNTIRPPSRGPKWDGIVARRDRGPGGPANAVPVAPRAAAPHASRTLPVPVESPPGRSLVTKRAVADVVRTATLGSYGVTGFAGHGLLPRVASRLRLRQPGMRIRLAPRLEIVLWLTVAWGLPVAEVARQVDSAVRYGLR